MYSFNNDYSTIAHDKIIKALIENKENHYSGYGQDIHCENAKNLIRKYIKKDVDIHFLIGGTSANKIIISHILKPYEAVISVKSGHINNSETGAIEANGHKILTAVGENGKITPAEIKAIYNDHNSEHMVKPKLVYISNSTEIGTIYTKKELIEIKEVCLELDLYLFIDGARLGSALTSIDNDLSLDDLANLTDCFYIGGTKNGALLGEAAIICNEELKENFRYSIKRNGGLLAKSFLIGIQFETLFTDNLFFEIAHKANDLSLKLKNNLLDLNIQFKYSSNTNQQFIILDNQIINKLQKKYSFEVWEQGETKSTIRLITSWMTKDHYIDEFTKDLKELLEKA